MEKFENRIGGLEKSDGSGDVDYDPDNHHFMTLQRQKKVDIIANFIPDADIYGESKGELLVLSWGGVYGSVKSAVSKARDLKLSVSLVHLRYLNPFPKNLGEFLVNFNKILVPELNLGQLLSMIRAKYLIDAKGFNKVAGKPFTSTEIFEKIQSTLKEK